MTPRTTIKVLVGLFSWHGAMSFTTPCRRPTRPMIVALHPKSRRTTSTKRSASEAIPETRCTWSPQDLTTNNPGFPPIPDDDYIKKYQKSPELWPVEFFAIAYRRAKNEGTRRLETQILVRESANRTSKYGLGTGVPATRWMPSSQAKPPAGYEVSEPAIVFDARNYPEFPRSGAESWTYTKIDIREDAFAGSAAFEDPELENYATSIRDELRARLSKNSKDGDGQSSWESSVHAVVQNIVEKPISVAAIQGTLRMSGLFAKRKNETTNTDRSSYASRRYVSLEDAPDPAELAESARVFAMFPQMPDPMPSPSAPAEELRKEIESRGSRMARSGRDPHKDRHGRAFTHVSTSNVSNTIHGVYIPLDVTKLSGLDVVPALDLFGTKEIEREWVSLSDLKVLEEDGKSISTVDTKPTFISGFIVRQLVKEGVIAVK